MTVPVLVAGTQDSGATCKRGRNFWQRKRLKGVISHRGKVLLHHEGRKVTEIHRIRGIERFNNEQGQIVEYRQEWLVQTGIAPLPKQGWRSDPI